MYSHNLLSTAEAISTEIDWLLHAEHGEAQERCASIADLLSMLTPPTDAALREAVDFSAEARCGRLARGILRIGKRLRVMRADMASQTDALIAAMHAINDAGILMPDGVLDYVSGVRVVQAPRLSGEQVEAVRKADRWIDRGRTDDSRKVSDQLRAAFPGVCEEG